MNGTLLYSLSSSGKMKVWSASTDYITDISGCIAISILWGYEEQKKQTKIRFVKSGKNLGKSNATTVVEQAKLELGYLYQKQLDDGYVTLENKDKLGTDFVPKKPMLAHKYADKKHLMLIGEDGKYLKNYYIQPKLNGFRCFATKMDEDTIVFTSRSGKSLTYFQFIAADLLPVMQIGDIVDGELFNPNVPFENISTLIKDSDKNVYDDNNELLYSEKHLQLHVYDYIGKDTDLPYNERLATINNIENTDYVKIVETLLINSLEEIQSNFSLWLEANYEGLMIRTSDGLYKFDYRSTDLLKYKEMIDAEFKIIDIFLAANDLEKVMFLLEVPDKGTVKCALKGNKKLNMKYFDNREEYLGKYMTLQYQTLTIYDIPNFPVGICLRDGEVVDGQFIPSL